MRFSYIATTKDGKTQQGIFEADQHDAALAILTSQQLHPVVLKVVKEKGLRKPFGSKVKLKDLVIFTRQLSTMISAGVPLARSMTTLQTQTNNKYFKEVIGGITKDVESGLPLGKAFARYPNVFSEVYVNMVKAGEAAGILDEILKRLATQAEKDASMRKKIKGAMTYPAVIFTITTAAFFLIMIYLMPKISKIITDLAGPNTQLPIYTRILLSLSHFMQHYAFFIILSVGTLVFFGLRYIKTPNGKYRYHALLLKIPILNVIIDKIAIARFARTFSALMAAGVGMLESLEITGGAIGNKVIEAELKEAAKEVKNGKQLSEPLSKSKNFPPIVSQMLAVGEETGQIDTILVKVADFYEEEVDTTIDSLSSIIEPLLILILGSAVGLIAASVMGPIASLNKNIGNN